MQACGEGHKWVCEKVHARLIVSLVQEIAQEGPDKETKGEQGVHFGRSSNSSDNSVNHLAHVQLPCDDEYGINASRESCSAIGPKVDDELGEYQDAAEQPKGGPTPEHSFDLATRVPGDAEIQQRIGGVKHRQQKAQNGYLAIKSVENGSIGAKK